ncbi:hypothetical protein BDZ89DRAFT_1114354 [Hymenopellis radicata]|nr:hypothetical protein BDZ89DRAFT_1114354 [Hymenopellis radicata]
MLGGFSSSIQFPTTEDNPHLFRLNSVKRLNKKAIIKWWVLSPKVEFYSTNGEDFEWGELGVHIPKLLAHPVRLPDAIEYIFATIMLPREISLSGFVKPYVSPKKIDIYDCSVMYCSYSPSVSASTDGLKVKEKESKSSATSQKRDGVFLASALCRAYCCCLRDGSIGLPRPLVTRMTTGDHDQDDDYNQSDDHDQSDDQHPDDNHDQDSLRGGDNAIVLGGWRS